MSEWGKSFIPEDCPLENEGNPALLIMLRYIYWVV